MGKNSCSYYPEVNGKRSKLYKDLLDFTHDRPTTNWLYAYYLATNVAAAMDSAGFQNKKDSRGEHKMNDYLNFIDYATIQSEVGSLGQIEKQIGAKDQQGQRIDYSNAEDALRIADTFNEPRQNGKPKGLVASVYKYGNVYNIIVSEKTSKTNTQPIRVKQMLQAWDVYKQVFNSVGIDITSMPQELSDFFSAYNSDMANDLLNLQRMQIQHLSRKNSLILFSLNANIQQVRALVGRGAFASLEDAAQAMEDINNRTGNYTTHQKVLLKSAVLASQRFNNINLNQLRNQINQITQQVASASPEESVKNTIDRLNRKFKIDVHEINRISRKINTLSEAAADAAMQLQRKIRELENIKGNNVEGKRLKTMLDQLLKELANKKYYSGILNFLQEASTNVQQIDVLLGNIPQTGTELEKAMNTAKILQDIKTIKDQYYAIVTALADPNLIIDESIGRTDIDNIKNTAQRLETYIKAKDKEIDDLVENTMITLLTQIIGNKTADGQNILNAVKLAQADSSILDYLYSIGRASNPIINAMGYIIRNAQNSRNGFMNDVSLRIRRATNKLYKSGSNSEFMYDGPHIISDIDWKAFSDAKKAAKKAFYQQGLRDFDLKQAMENWVDANTEDRIVDSANNRAERVPNSQYRKNNGMVWNSTTNKMEFSPSAGLTKEQQDYYNEMMQLKGEIGTLLPAYAQLHYLAPQLRRNMLDALGHAKSADDVARALKNKWENLYKIREDDTEYNINGQIDGEDYHITESAYNDTALRQIPIFFVNRIKDQGELLKDFSSGIAALAGTAINYDAMSSVCQVVEFMGDFAKSKIDPKTKVSQADVVENKAIRVFKSLYKRSRNSNTEGLIDGFISQHIYGQRLDPEQFGYKWAKLATKLIGYTSFKNLSTNIKGAFSNYLVGEFQMAIEAAAGEFYGVRDYIWANYKLFGFSGVTGELAELLTNNMNHKATLFREMFDPISENFSDKSHKRYYKSAFRQLISHDCSFIGYATGEYLIHYVNMYAILHRQKVKLGNEIISLYDAFEVTNKQDGNSELRLKQGVTTLHGEAITSEWLEGVKGRIKHVNDMTHGAMDAEDKGLIHQKLAGRGVMNFRQWMVEHYSRRFRKGYTDFALNTDTSLDYGESHEKNREGYWRSTGKFLRDSLISEDLADLYEDRNNKVDKDVMLQFMKDLTTFSMRAKVQWSNMTELQRYNCKRTLAEMSMYFALLGLSFALGEPDEHKKEFWKRWWIYQTKRLILDTEASMPNLRMISSGLTILQSPMAGVDTLNSFLYAFYGLTNGDITKELQSGPHKGENKYLRNIKKNVLPFYKDWEQMQRFDEDKSIFQVFEDNPGRR